MTKGQAILQDENNRFTVSTHMRPHLKEPEPAAVEPEMEVEFQDPVYRLRRKTTLEAPGMRALKKDEVQQDLWTRKKRKEMVGALMNAEVIKGTSPIRRVKLKEQGEHGPESKYVTFGAFQHGGVIGTTAATKENVNDTKALVELVKRDFPGECFTSITLVRNAALPPHKDKFNAKGSWNLLSPMVIPDGGGVWEELKPGDVFTGTYKEMMVNEERLPGQFHNLKDPQKVNPHRLHAPVQGAEGERIVLAGHTVSAWKKLSMEKRQELEALGFPVPEDMELVSGYDPSRGSDEPPVQCKVHVAEENFIENYPVDDLVERMEDEVRIAKAASEGLYTSNIEELLATMEGDLRVVHTVKQSEVEPNLSEWKEALQAEMDALVNMGAIEKLRGTKAKALLNRPDVTIVPGKGVYTVKPPQKAGRKFRRKVRIVSCGNYVEKSSDEHNYSGGADAESVRLAIAESARRRWNIGAGDIKNAFLRAPVPDGVILVLRPPAILVRAGLATPDELWQCHTAMYGYRSSPRWWSDYRNGKMKTAVTTMNRRFHQGEVDKNVWQIREVDGTLCGYIIVYVDDVMITGSVATIKDAYKWIEETWEATRWSSPRRNLR